MKTSTLSDVQREMWKKVMAPEFMSSEETGEEEMGKKGLLLKRKCSPGGHLKLDRFFKTLGSKGIKEEVISLSSRLFHELLAGIPAVSSQPVTVMTFFGFVSA